MGSQTHYRVLVRNYHCFVEIASNILLTCRAERRKIQCGGKKNPTSIKTKHKKKREKAPNGV